MRKGFLRTIIAAGALADLLPRKAVFGGCLTLMFTGAILLATLKPGLVMPALYLFGLGWGGNYTMLQGLVADVFGARSLGKILGGITVLDATGGALGPWVTGTLFDLSHSYRSAFLVMALLIAVALARLEETDGEFDLIFNDVDKEGYPDVARRAIPRLRVGGLLVTDNVLWDGFLRLPPGEDDAETAAIREHNRLLYEHPDVETTIVPLRDGVSVARRLR